MTDPVTTLRSRLAAYPAASHPVEHATIRFNIGLALAEDPAGDRSTALRSAIAEYAAALAGFAPDDHPRERSRVLTALGAAERDLGLALQARDRFREALALVDAEEAAAEFGSAANGLGLALLDLEEIESAIDTYRVAAEAFGTSHPRQRATVLHNLGQAVAAKGDVGSIEEAIRVYRVALELVTPTTEGYVWGSLQHALAVLFLDLPDDRADRIREAIRAETSALTIFTRRRYPFQHAMAKNNLAVAYEELGPSDVTMLRRALVSIEEAVTVFDPRLHPQPSDEARRNLHRIEGRLRRLVGAELGRIDHFVALAAVTSPPERIGLLRSRLGMIFDQVPVARDRSLTLLDRAVVGLPAEPQADVTRSWLAVLMERPKQDLRAGLNSRLAVHGELEPADRVAASRAIEAALGELEVLQRVAVRDALVEMGYQRPDGA